MNRARSQNVVQGFTLIELLVVIAIIALLSAVVVSSLNAARAKGDDARRIADMREIQKAVELYYNDNGHYPNSNNTWVSFNSPAYSPNPIVSPNAVNLATALSPYMPVAHDPKEPLSGDAGYLYTGSGTNYCILIYRTPENMNDFSSSTIPTRCGSVSNGACTASPNVIFTGVGTFVNGC